MSDTLHYKQRMKKQIDKKLYKRRKTEKNNENGTEYKKNKRRKNC